MESTPKKLSDRSRLVALALPLAVLLLLPRHPLQLASRLHLLPQLLPVALAEAPSLRLSSKASP